MAGNVWEWVADLYNTDYYQYCLDNGIVNDPPGPTGPLTNRVVRGGGWRLDTQFLHVADRLSINPDNSYVDRGFRCAR